MEKYTGVTVEKPVVLKKVYELFTISYLKKTVFHFLFIRKRLALKRGIFLIFIGTCLYQLNYLPMKKPGVLFLSTLGFFDF